MACNFPRIDELRNYIKNGKNVPLYNNPNPTQTEISEAMDYMNRSMGLTEIPNINPKDKGDDKRRYTVRSETGDFFTDAYLEKRVSDKTNKKFKKGRTEEEVEAIRNDPNNIIKREFGTAGHSLADELGQLYYNTKIGGTYPKNFAQLVKEYGEGEYPFNPDQVASLYKGVKAIIDEVFLKQSKINPDINPIIKFEQYVGDTLMLGKGTPDWAYVGLWQCVQNKDIIEANTDWLTPDYYIASSGSYTSVTDNYPVSLYAKRRPICKYKLNAAGTEALVIITSPFNNGYTKETHTLRLPAKSNYSFTVDTFGTYTTVLRLTGL